MGVLTLTLVKPLAAPEKPLAPARLCTEQDTDTTLLWFFTLTGQRLQSVHISSGDASAGIRLKGPSPLIGKRVYAYPPKPSYSNWRILTESIDALLQTKATSMLAISDSVVAIAERRNSKVG
jgi:hypothetical protein